MPEPTISSAGLRIIKILVGNAPKTVTDLIRATGVTRTAVTEQLNELVSSGLIERNVERLPGRGRPRHVYSANHTALLLLFPSSPNLLVPAIWRAIDELGGCDLTKEVVTRVSGSVADYYNAKITAKDPSERLQQLIQLFEDEGGLVEPTSQDGQPALRKRSCPFIAMLDAKRTVCAIDLEMMTAIVGCPVRRVACRHDGAPSCVFEIDRDT